MKQILTQLSINAISLNPDLYAANQKASAWIGHSPASKESITKTEEKLGINLPDDVKEFYSICNGTSEILSHIFSGFDAIEHIDWLKNAIPDTLVNYEGMGEAYVQDLANSIVIAGVNHVHNILIIQPHGEHKTWRYWEFASYIPGENEFRGIQKYLERINDFLEVQIKNQTDAI